MTETPDRRRVGDQPWASATPTSTFSEHLAAVQDKLFAAILDE